MSAGRMAVLRPGDWVIFDGGEHQVVGFAGTPVRLRTAAGVEQVVLAAYLMSSAGFGAEIIKNEQRWLPGLALRLPLPIPYPERTGVPPGVTRTHGA